MSKKDDKKKDVEDKTKGKKGKKDDDHTHKKTRRRDDKKNVPENSDDEEEEMVQSKHKKGKSEKGQGLTILLETKIQSFDVRVEVTGLFNYYDVFHKLIYLHDVYRTTNKSLDSEYKIEYFHNGNWSEFLPLDFDKLQEKTRMRVINRTYSIPVQLPVIERPKQQYLGINLKALQELPTGIISGKLSPYVALWVSTQKQHKYRTLIKQHANDCTFNENFVIPVSYTYIQKGKIACFLEVAVFNFVSGSHGTDPKIGKAKLPLAVLERGHAKPRGVMIKLDKGGIVDMEIRWFENDQLIVAPEDTKGFRRSIGIGGVFFTPPSLVKAKNLKKPRADELEWFLNLPQIPLKDLQPGDIAIVKFYDCLYEDDKPCNEVFYQNVEAQRDIPLTKATCFSVSSFLVTKEGGENIGIQCTGGIALESKFPNYNCLVYRCKNAEYAKEAVAWAQEIFQKYPNIKFSPPYEELDISPNVENQNQMAAREVPETMMDSEFIAGAYQCRKGNPMIDSYAKHLSPCLLENHLNTHLENGFSFVGIVVQHIDEQEIAKRGPPRGDKPKKAKGGKEKGPATAKTPKKTKTTKKTGKQDEGNGDEGKPEPTIPLALMGPTGVHKPIFGLSLIDAYGEGPHVPYFWESVFSFLNQEEFCATVGIFRVPGSADEANWYKKLFEEGRDVVFDCSCHDAVGLLKMYIRELPENVIPPSFDQQVPYIMSQYKEGSLELLTEIKFIIDSLPKAHYLFFKLLMSLLYNILQQAEINKMHSDNIIRCIVPTMKCGPQIVALAFNNYQFMFGEGISNTEIEMHSNDGTKSVDAEKHISMEDRETKVETSEQTGIPHSRAISSPAVTGNNRGNRGVRQVQTPKEPAVRARPAWMGGPGGQQKPPEVLVNEPSFNKVTINIEANEYNEKELSPVTPRKKENGLAESADKQKKKKNRRSEVFFYNPIISQTTAQTELEVIDNNDTGSQLESAFALAEANESESSESADDYSDPDSMTSSSSEEIIK